MRHLPHRLYVLKNWRKNYLRRDQKFLWARAADFPLPSSFCEGKEKFEEILSLMNPTNRVNEMNAHKDILRSGNEVISSISAFYEKWGAAYIEMNRFAAKT